ncbi:MAG: YkgJ family cysteine cluster protein [Desulfococcaceae bacterium]|jgi:Fe-S-cluster containining protein|nr:YkgJ family cysteine cluster protein [Desulfococcaceae bacterium]
MSSDESSDIFDCQQCGECCRGYGGTYVTPEDMQAIARYINTDPDTFGSQYCRMSGSRAVLAQGENSYCIFWKDKICTIHPVKPRMCKAWPFIRSVLSDVGNWRAMAGSCPGMRTDVSDEKILRCVRQEIERREKGLL